MRGIHWSIRPALCCWLFVAAHAVWGADSFDSTPGDVLQPARAAIEAGKYEQAIGLLKEIALSEPKNADVQNLLGFSHRKLGQFELALQYYQEALRLEPLHRGANEYLGELYLETGQLEKAEERLRVLEKACPWFWRCKEYDDLKADVEKYKKRPAA
jgi:Flp pilus assembly protein TadD